mgnify:CR=1 FL=1
MLGEKMRRGQQGLRSGVVGRVAVGLADSVQQSIAQQVKMPAEEDVA